MNHPRPAPPGTLALLTGLALLLLTACASTPSGPSAGSQPNSGSAGPAGTARPQPASPATSPATSAAPSTTPTGCSPAPASMTIQPGDQPAPVCLHPGDTLTLTARSSPTQPWQPLTSTDPTTLSCTTQTQPNGALTATCHALRPGTATVSTGTAAFSGDPHGPAQYTWTLTIEVRAAQ